MTAYEWKSVETDGPTSAGFQVWVAYPNPNHPHGWNLIVEWTPLGNTHLELGPGCMWRPIDFPPCPTEDR